jgi:peroxiredoxin
MRTHSFSPSRLGRLFVRCLRAQRAPARLLRSAIPGSLFLSLGLLFTAMLVPAAGDCQGSVPPELIFTPGVLKSVDSTLRVAVGDKAPSFDLPAIDGSRVSLAQYAGKKNVLLSFVPAAWTPVCSGQWPGYNLAHALFEKHDTVLVGISVDNLPTLHAWVKEMGGLWFPVVSDFWPHGALAQAYGILRPQGVTERALVLIDKQGVIRYIDVHDINTRPDLGVLAAELDRLQ